jgi:hypothetical protein
LASGRRLAKRFPDVQQAGADFPRHPKRFKHQKPPKFPRLWLSLAESKSPASEPLRTAPAAVVPAVMTVAIPLAAHHAMLETVPPPATAKPAFPARQNSKAPLLAVIERLVERVRGICDLLQRRRRTRHVVGALTQPRQRIVRLLLVLRFIPPRVHPRIGAFQTQLGEITYRALHRRPQLFLVGIELQPGMDGGNPRVGESGAILGTEPHVPHMLVKPRTMLGIDRGRTGDGKGRDTGDGEVLHVSLLSKVSEDERARRRNQLTVWKCCGALRTCNLAFQIIPNARGSHSDISGT